MLYSTLYLSHYHSAYHKRLMTSETAQQKLTHKGVFRGNSPQQVTIIMQLIENWRDVRGTAEVDCSV